MVRRPVKKRKPRKVTAKPIKTEVEKDPFYIDPKSIPKGKAYQWVVHPSEGDQYQSMWDRAVASGWRRVGKRLVKGSVLMWASNPVANAQRNANIKLAKDQMIDADSILGRGPETHAIDRRFPLAAESFMVSSDYGSVPYDAEPMDVEVKVKLRLSRRFQDAAASLKLTLEVYAQRRMDLYVRGELAGLLLPVAVSALELFEGGKFELTPRN